MKPQKIDYSKLRECDVVVTGGRGLFGYFIRWVTSGFKKRHDAGGAPTHVGILFSIYGELVIAEMLKDGLTISPLKRYTKKNRRKVIDVVRFEDLQRRNRVKMQKRVAKDLRLGLDYDWAGVFSFIDGDVKDKPEAYFCSEYVTFLLTELGGVDCILKPSDVAPADFSEPFDIFPDASVKSVDGWEFAQ